MSSRADILNKFTPISLEEMKGVKLMNRIDTKYVTTESILSKLLELCQPHYSVQTMNGMREMPYHTVYYDTADEAMYRTHHHGKLTRQKVREREYEADGMAFLEVKMKNNRGRTRKKRVARDLDENLRKEFVEKWSIHPYSSLSPKIENRFTRITLVNHAKTERVTIDTSLQFNHFKTKQQQHLDGLVIIEVKRDGHQKSEITEFFKQLRIKQSGFSKYCIGMALTDPALPSNRFKERLRMIQKLRNHQY